MAKAKKVLAAVGEPDVMPAPAPAPIAPASDLPWLDAKGQALAKGDFVEVPGSIYEGRTGCITCLEPPAAADQSPAVWVDFPETAHDTKVSDIFVPTDVVRLEPVAAAHVAKPAPSKPKGLSFEQFQEAGHAYGVGLRLVPLAYIVVTTNTRKVFDETALAELAESVKAHGILQPIVLRPLANEAGRYELVAGGRRYRAAQLAGLVEVPATVRNLSDREFLEVQLLENLQRVDVRPADEAQAFSKLLGSHLSAEEIAQRVGKPVKFVLKRAKLVALIPFWLELLEEEKLPLVAAHELARLPAHSQVVVRKAMEDGYSYELKQAAINAQTIQRVISQKVFNELTTAAFPKKDPLLYPMAGACVTCPKRSGANPGLFQEENDASTKRDFCLDGACFAEKKRLFVQRQVVTLTVDGKKPVLVSSSYEGDRKSGFASAYGWSKYSSCKPTDKGAVEALVVDGTEAGKTIWVIIRGGDPVAANEQKKIDRTAEIRKDKISEQYRQLLSAHLYTQSLHSGRVSEAHLENRIYDQLRSQGGPHTPLRLALATYFGWEMPEGGEKALRKLTPASDYSGLRAWEKANVDRLSYEEKLAFYFALLGYNCSTFDSSNERLLKYAKGAGADVGGLKKQATEAVDAPKGKKQEATA